MSVETWRKEFCPVSPEALVVPWEPSLEQRLEQAQATWLKWKGFLPENLEKHGVWIDLDMLCWPTVREPGYDHYIVYSDTCVFCLQDRVGRTDPSCSNCPFTKVLDRGCQKEYTHFSRTRDPGPMLARLENLVRLIKNRLAAEKGDTPQ